MSTEAKDDASLVHIQPKDIGWNVPFLVQISATESHWGVRIDDSKFIYIGQNGAYYFGSDMLFFVAKEDLK